MTWPSRRVAWRPHAVTGAALLVVAVFGAALALGLRPPAAAPDGTPVLAAPPLAGPTLDGGRFDLAQARGQVILVNVFASWCEPCRTELPLLAQARRRWSGQGLRLVALDVRDDVGQVRELLRQTRTEDLTVVPDPSGTTAVSWGVRGVPETFVVDRDGRLAHRAQGAVTMRWLEQRVTPLLTP